MIVSLWVLNRQWCVLWLWAVKLIFYLPPFQQAKTTLFLVEGIKKKKIVTSHETSLTFRWWSWTERSRKSHTGAKELQLQNRLVLLNRKRKQSQKRLREINKQKKWLWTTMEPEAKPPQMFMFSWLYIGFTSETRLNWTKPLWRGLVNRRDSCNVTFNPNKSMWMQPTLYTHRLFCSIGKKRWKEEKVKVLAEFTLLCLDLQNPATCRRRSLLVCTSWAFLNNITRPNYTETMVKPSQAFVCKTSFVIVFSVNSEAPPPIHRMAGAFTDQADTDCKL